MTVLYIIDRGIQGGATVAFIDMIMQMQKLGVKPIIATGRFSELNEMLNNQGIMTIADGHYMALTPFSFKRFYWPLGYIKRLLLFHIFETISFRRLCNRIDFNSIDLIHTNSARNTIGCKLSRKYGIPHIVHIREFADKDFNCIKLMPSFYNYLNSNTTAFVSVSKAVFDHWNENGVDKKKNRIIYDGVNNRDIKESSRLKQNRILKLVMVGGVVPTKGQHLAVEAIGLLPKDIMDNVYLDILGWYDDSYLKSLKEYANSRGYGFHINYLGSVKDVHARLCNYDIGLVCSRSEGFGLVTAEYMHAGLGVIASDSGACPELIENRVTGLLFQSGNSKALAKCILDYYNDRLLLQKCGLNAQSKAKNSFTDEINSKNIIELYNDIINHNK